MHNRRWYLLGHFQRKAKKGEPEIKRDGLPDGYIEYYGTFSLDRIISLKVTSEIFIENENFDAKEYFKECFGIVHGDGTPLQRVVIRAFEFERFNLALNNYLKRYHIVEDQDIIEQSELDKTIIRNEKEPVVTLPKGLDKNTLSVVWKCILTFDGMFTTEEVSAKVGISRVSIRKYLEFLKTLRLLKLDLHRGSVGRPVYKYLCVDKQSDVLNVYTQ
jgi:hypothetical protein